MLRNILLVYQHNKFFQKAFEVALDLAKIVRERFLFQHPYQFRLFFLDNSPSKD